MEEPKKEEVKTPEENIDDLKAQIATLTTERDNVVGEIKEDREKRKQMQEQIDTLQEALETATKANTKPDGTVDVSDLVKKAIDETLSQRDASTAKSNKVTAIERFVNEHKSFHPENDTTGKRREALENAVSRFNTDGLTTVEEFYKVVADAAKLLGDDTSSTESTPTEEVPNADVPSTPSTPKVATGGDVTPEEQKLYESNGWTKEKYIALRDKNPNFIKTLLAATNY